ncbi:MarR family transcriptional regulator [Amycolatopsis sp. NPDC051716]|uniref:MarR family winged helix-turn-helix transcriptional regulator n=1 Tax=Amycolatopsis sp. NPDC051716 TaxID=3155804 RepID=UPI00344130E7
MAASGAEHYSRALRSVGLKAQHLGVLVLLQDGLMVQSRLGEHLGVFKPVKVSLINELEKMALVRRMPHPTDRRAVEVNLLPAGRQRIKTADKVSRSATDEFFAPLTPVERRLFHEMLAKLTDRPSTRE